MLRINNALCGWTQSCLPTAQPCSDKSLMAWPGPGQASKLNSFIPCTVYGASPSHHMHPMRASKPACANCLRSQKSDWTSLDDSHEEIQFGVWLSLDYYSSLFAAGRPIAAHYSKVRLQQHIPHYCSQKHAEVMNATIPVRPYPKHQLIKAAFLTPLHVHWLTEDSQCSIFALD